MELRHRHRPVSATPRPASWIGRFRTRARDNRGVAIIEAAFVTPVFFILVLGILEVGLAMNDYLGLASTVRAGSRAASASGNDPTSDLYTVLGIARESAAIDRDSIVQVVVYKPSSFGKKPTAGCQAGVAQTGICNVYDASDFLAASIQVKEEADALAQNRPVDQSKVVFGCKGTSPDRFWCPTDRRVRVIDPSIQGYSGPDYVGVWMKIEHPSVSRALGDLTFTDQSVIRLEPRGS